MKKSILQKTINEIIRDKDILELSEADTEYYVILPILNALGWDTHSKRECRRQYDVLGKKVDFCLFFGKDDKIFIEVKRPREVLDIHQEQILDYASKHMVQLAILTNGITWELYLPTEKGLWKDRKFDEIQLKGMDTELIIDKFTRYLSRANVNSGVALQAAMGTLSSVIVTRRLKEEEATVLKELPILWRNILTEPDSRILKLLKDAFKKNHGIEPEDRLIIEFLKAQISKPALPFIKPKKGKKGMQPIIPGGLTYTKPFLLVYNGIEKEIRGRSWIATYQTLCELLYRDNGSAFAELALPLYGKSTPFFSSDPEDFRTGTGALQTFSIEGSGLFANANLSALAVSGRMKTLNEVFSMSGLVVIHYLNRVGINHELIL